MLVTSGRMGVSWMSDRSWWLQSILCEACNKHVRKHHLARHRQSKVHLMNEGLAYSVKQSDLDFAAFLSCLHPNMLKGAERRMYEKVSGVSR